jgi:hypothetical protein
MDGRSRAFPCRPETVAPFQGDAEAKRRVVALI